MHAADDDAEGVSEYLPRLQREHPSSDAAPPSALNRPKGQDEHYVILVQEIKEELQDCALGRDEEKVWVVQAIKQGQISGEQNGASGAEHKQNPTSAPPSFLTCVTLVNPRAGEKNPGGQLEQSGASETPLDEVPYLPASQLFALQLACPSWSW